MRQSRARPRRASHRGRSAGPGLVTVDTGKREGRAAVVIRGAVDVRTAVEYVRHRTEAPAEDRALGGGDAVRDGVPFGFIGGYTERDDGSNECWEQCCAT